MRLTEEEVSVFGGVTEDEVDHYKEVFADNGAELPLGLYYLFGAGGVDRNLPQALELLSRVNTPAAYAFIGRIYAEGSPPDIEQSNDTAIKYFKKAIEHQSLEGYTGLAIMYYTGMGVQQDYIQALDYFQKAAARGLSEAHLYIGLSYLYGRGVQVNYIKAFHSLESAAQGGHIAAFYHLAEIYAKGLTAKRNCPKAVELYKIVSERGKWTQLNKEAYRLYMAGDVDSSLMMYLHLGELGIEVAQCNAAYILEDDMVMINETELLKRALLQWSRSATQGYSVARVKLGDFYYYGKGADQDFELAAEQYRLASDRMASPQAMFNLGYMYENGIGLQKDYDLAKRYYDLAAETSSDALIPVNLALIKLNFMYYYQTVLEKLQDNDNIIVLLQNVDTDNWDIYLIAVLFVVLAVVIRWYRR
jgi:SEL1 protein